MEITIFEIIILPHATTIIIITVLLSNDTRILFINEAYSTLIGFKQAINFMHCQGAITHKCILNNIVFFTYKRIIKQKAITKQLH